MFDLKTIGAIIIAIFGFGFLKGRRSEKNKRVKKDLETYEKANETRKEVEKIPDSKLTAELDELLND